jgi:hypothetical protein
VLGDRDRLDDRADDRIWRRTPPARSRVVRRRRALPLRVNGSSANRLSCAKPAGRVISYTEKLLSFGAELVVSELDAF